MKPTIRFKGADEDKAATARSIEIVTTVEQTVVLSIDDLEAKIASCDEYIAERQKEKDALLRQKADIMAELQISVDSEQVTP